MRLRKFQVGGQMPQEGAAPAPEQQGGGDPMAQLMQAAAEGEPVFFRSGGSMSLRRKIRQ